MPPQLCSTMEHCSGLLFLCLCLCLYLSTIWTPSPYINPMYSVLKLQFEYHILNLLLLLQEPWQLYSNWLVHTLWQVFTSTFDQPQNTGPLAWRQGCATYGEVKSHTLSTLDFLGVTSGVQPVLIISQNFSKIPVTSLKNSKTFHSCMRPNDLMNSLVQRQTHFVQIMADTNWPWRSSYLGRMSHLLYLRPLGWRLTGFGTKI